MNKVDIGFQAVKQALAVKACGFPITSIGSLLDEPFTGIIFPKDIVSFRLPQPDRKEDWICWGVQQGKIHQYTRTYSDDCDAYIWIDELTKYYGRKPTDYETIRCGMNVLEDIIDGGIHAYRFRDCSGSGIGGMASWSRWPSLTLRLRWMVGVERNYLSPASGG
jgi:pyrimidine precursor biosynthesis enzyme